MAVIRPRVLQRTLEGGWSGVRNERGARFILRGTGFVGARHSRRAMHNDTATCMGGLLLILLLLLQLLPLPRTAWSSWHCLTAAGRVGADGMCKCMIRETER